MPNQQVRKYLAIVFRTAATPVLLFLTVAVGWTILLLPVNLSPRVAALPATVGFAVGAIIFSLGCRFSGLYVLGHELTHYLAAKLCFRKTGPLKVGLRDGSVTVEHPNVFIVLSPYIIPGFALAWIGLYGVILFVYPEPGWRLVSAFYAGVGLSYAYHVVLTFVALWRGQDDLKLYGPVFSLSAIFFGNAVTVFAATVIAGRHWHEALPLLVKHVMILATALARMSEAIAAWLQQAL